MATIVAFNPHAFVSFQQETPANEEDPEGAEKHDDMDTNTLAEEKDEKEEEDEEKEGKGEEGAEAPEEEEKPTSQLRRLDTKKEEPTGQEGDTAQDVGVEVNTEEQASAGEVDTELQVTPLCHGSYVF